MAGEAPASGCGVCRHHSEVERFMGETRALLVSGDKLTAQRFEDLNRLMEVTRGIADRALIRADAVMDKRVEAINELRGVVTDQQATFITREAAELLISGLRSDISPALQYVLRHQGEAAGVKSTWAVLLALVSVAGAIGALVIR
jgi:hypothetical protein